MVAVEERLKHRPKNLRTILLAFPKKRQRKYVPPVYIPGSVDAGVRPAAIHGIFEDNWRINQLSLQRDFKKTEKYVFVPEEGVGTGITRATLAGSGTERTNHVGLPNLRKLKVLRKMSIVRNTPQLVTNCDKTINQCWNSVYHYYHKQLAILKKKRQAKRKQAAMLRAKEKTGKGKDGKGKGKGGKTKGGKDKGGKTKPKTEKELLEEKEKELTEWCTLRAQPKKLHRPTPISRGKIADLIQLAESINQLSEPRIRKTTNKFVRPSLDALYIDPLKVSEAAKAYQVTERVIELAKCPAHRLAKEPKYIPGGVKRGALTSIISPRSLELAEPKKRTVAVDSDLKENPFLISPNAKKYVASERIKELAKPIDR